MLTFCHSHVSIVLQNLGADPNALRWYQQAELVHGRTAMTAVAGILIPGVSTSSTVLMDDTSCSISGTVIL